LAGVLTGHRAVDRRANAPRYALHRVSHRIFRLFGQDIDTLRKLESKNNPLNLGYNRVEMLEERFKYTRSPKLHSAVHDPLFISLMADFTYNTYNTISSIILSRAVRLKAG
jgi:hypothetical protein